MEDRRLQTTMLGYDIIYECLIHRRHEGAFRCPCMNRIILLVSIEVQASALSFDFPWSLETSIQFSLELEFSAPNCL